MQYEWGHSTLCEAFSGTCCEWMLCVCVVNLCASVSLIYRVPVCVCFFLINTCLCIKRWVIRICLSGCASRRNVCMCSPVCPEHTCMSVCVCLCVSLWETDKDKEAWNDNAAVQRQRMWSQIKATRLPLCLSLPSCCFSGLRKKGKHNPFLPVLFFPFASQSLLTGAKKRGGSMQ